MEVGVIVPKLEGVLLTLTQQDANINVGQCYGLVANDVLEFVPLVNTPADSVSCSGR